MFDRIAPVYDVMNRVMTAGLDQRWRRATAAASCGRATASSTCAAGPATSRSPRAQAGGRVTGVDFSRAMLERARPQGAPSSSGCRPTCWRCRSRTGRSTRRRPASASATWTTSRPGCARRAVCCGPADGSRSSRSRSPRACCGRSSALWFDRVVPLLGKVLPGGDAYTYLPASVRRFPGPEALAAAIERAPASAGSSTGSSPAASSRCTRGRPR